MTESNAPDQAGDEAPAETTEEESKSTTETTETTETEKTTEKPADEG